MEWIFAVMRGYCPPGAPQRPQVLPHWALGPVPCSFTCCPVVAGGAPVLLVSCHPSYSKGQTQVSLAGQGRLGWWGPQGNIPEEAGTGADASDVETMCECCSMLQQYLSKQHNAGTLETPWSWGYRRRGGGFAGLCKWDVYGTHTTTQFPPSLSSPRLALARCLHCWLQGGSRCFIYVQQERSMPPRCYQMFWESFGLRFYEDI